ncbi:MAG: hypothetical protein V4531_03855 [Actinomycetota bacterium]
MESRKHSRTISPELSCELEGLVFDLVRERLLKAVGAGGMWTLQFRASTDTDSLFGETISEYIARDIADQISASVAIEGSDAPVEGAEAAVDDHTRAADDDEIAVENTEWIDARIPVEAKVLPVAEVAAEGVEPNEHDEHDEHRMFKPRKAA